MRVCDINSFYSPRAGGVKTYHRRKIDYFLRHPEHDYTLVYAGKDPGTDELSPHVRVVRVPGVRMTADYHFVLNAVGLRRVLDRIEPDLIEIGEPYFLPWVTRVACAGRRIPILGYWHADFPITYVRRPVSRLSPRLGCLCERVAWWYARGTYGQLTAILAGSRTIKWRLIEHGLDRVYHTPLGVDTDVFSPSKRDPRLRAEVGAALGEMRLERPLLFFPHRLTEEKGITVMLEAYAQISEATGAVLAVAGTGPRESVLRSYMDRYRHIHYLGYVSDQEMLARWYASSDLVFALSAWETFGLTALEGMASGCPIVAADGGALPELVSEAACGLVVPHNRADLVAEAAVSLLTDAEAHQNAADAARDYAVRHHDWDRTFDQIVCCYREVVDAGETSRSRSSAAPATEG